jgi:aminobenzoyl-glutamate utilization protein B
MMTETTATLTVQAGSWEILTNRAGAELIDANLAWLGTPAYTPDEQAFAKEIQRATNVPETGIDTAIHPLDGQVEEGGSTDVGDVSWVVPTVQVHAPTVAIGTPFHTWQVVAQGKSPHAHKAMVQAAKAMAGLGVRALTEPDLIAAAKADLKKRTTRTPYVSPLPDSVAPPLDMSLI